MDGLQLNKLDELLWRVKEQLKRAELATNTSNTVLYDKLQGV